MDLRKKILLPLAFAAVVFPTNIPDLKNFNIQTSGEEKFCPATTACSKKNEGDANCDGTVNDRDFLLWQDSLDRIIPAEPPNQNPNFSCVEGNTGTYYIDVVDFEIWRRNTVEGLFDAKPTAVPSPTPTLDPNLPTPTAVPPTPTSAPAQPTATSAPAQQPTDPPQTGAKRSCDEVASGCVSACIAVDWDRTTSPYRTGWTSSDVSVKWNVFYEIDGYPRDGLELRFNGIDGNTGSICYGTSCSPNSTHGPLSGSGSGDAHIVAKRQGCEDDVLTVHISE